MAPIRASELVLTGAHGFTTTPGAALSRDKWAGAPARLSRMDRLCALALVACDGALVDAGLSPTAPEWNGERTAIVLGTAYGCHATNEEYYRGLLREGPAGASPRLFAYTLPSSPVGEVSIHYRIRGPATALGNGLAADLDALVAGMATVARGQADRAIACAAEVATPLLQGIVDGAAGLFSVGALVDGAAAFTVERAADAATRGTSPRARLTGSASVFRAGNRAAAVSAAIAAALERAELAAAAIDEAICAPADAASATALGIRGGRELPAAGVFPTGALAAAPLVALAAALSDGRERSILMAAGDDGGAASAAIIAVG